MARNEGKGVVFLLSADVLKAFVKACPRFQPYETNSYRYRNDKDAVSIPCRSMTQEETEALYKVYQDRGNKPTERWSMGQLRIVQGDVS